MELDVSDVYFITRLSRRGLVPILTRSRPSGENMGEVMERVCLGPQFGSKSAKVDIATIRDLTLRAVLFTMTRAAGLQAPYEATKIHLILATKYLNPIVFYWATTMTVNMKRQLTKCK